LAEVDQRRTGSWVYAIHRFLKNLTPQVLIMADLYMLQAHTSDIFKKLPEGPAHAGIESLRKEMRKMEITGPLSIYEDLKAMSIEDSSTHQPGREGQPERTVDSLDRLREVALASRRSPARQSRPIPPISHQPPQFTFAGGQGQSFACRGEG